MLVFCLTLSNFLYLVSKSAGMFLYHNKTNGYIGVFTDFLDSVLNKSFEFFIMCGCPTKYNLRICPEITVGNANSFIEGFLTKLINSLSHTFPRGTFKKYVRSRFPRFEPRSPTCLSLFVFEPNPTPPPHSPQGTFVLAGTHPLPLNLYICEI